MNLFYFLVCNVLGLTAFAKAVVIFMILLIIYNFAILKITGAGVGGVIIGIIRIIALILFIKLGFPITGILIFNLLLSILASFSVFADPIVGVINIIELVLNIIGMILFYTKLL